MIHLLSIGQLLFVGSVHCWQVHCGAHWIVEQLQCIVDQFAVEKHCVVEQHWLVEHCGSVGCGEGAIVHLAPAMTCPSARQ